MVECSYCACRVVVERRLRTSEPEVGDPRALRRLEWEEVTSTLHCGGCGAPLDYDESQLVLVCPACKTQARVERRLRRLFSAPGDTEPDCTHTLALIRKVAHEPELADRVLAAEALQDWHRMNATLARHMPELMRAIGTADPRLGFPVARVVGRMLCTDDRFQHDCVLEAAAEVLRAVFNSPAGVPQAVHDLIRQRGDSLPEDFRRLYLEHRPDCPHLSELPVRYWQSSSQEEPLQEAVEAWRAGISQAVEAYRVQETRADDYRTRIGQRTPLMAAATRGDVRLVSELLERGEDPDEVNSSGWTALMFAAEAGRVSAVRLLLDRGADACVRDEAGRQALTVAALERHRAVLDELRQAVSEADIAQVYRESFIQRNWPALEWALANDADPDTLEDEGRTPLVLASREGDLALVRRLLAAGAYLHHTDSSGRCALIHAARRGHLSLVRLLLAAGADPERTDREGETARGWAAKHGHIEVEQALDGS